MIGVSREAYSYHDITLTDVEYLLEHFRGRSRVNKLYIVAHHREIERKETCQYSRRTCADNVYVLRIAKCVNRAVELFLVTLFERLFELVNVHAYYLFININITHSVVHNIDPLNCREHIARVVFQRALKFGITLVAKLCRKTNHRRFAHPDNAAELRCRHECRLVIMIEHILRNFLVTL